MAFPFILYSNIYELNTPTATSEAAGYDIENVTDWRTYIRWRATTTSTQHIYIDAGTNVTVDALGIAGHNLGDVTAIVKVESSTTGAYAGEETTRLSVFNVNTNDVITKPMTAASDRYWRVSLFGLNATPEIGVLCLGERLDFPKNPNKPLVFIDEKMEVSSERSKGGHILGSVNYYRPYTVVLSFSWLLIAFVQGDLYTFWSTHGSKHKPFFLQINTDQWDAGRFVQLPEGQNFKEVFDDYTYTTNLALSFEGTL